MEEDRTQFEDKLLYDDSTVCDEVKIIMPQKQTQG